MRNNGIIILVLSCLFIITSCDNEEVNPEHVDLGYQYSPLSHGDYWEYEVRKIDYLLSGDKDTTEYFLREVIEDSIVDFDEVSYHMYRYYRPDTISSWSLDSIWQTKRLPSRLIRTENNVRIIKLIFPVKEEVEWDGNALNGQNGYEAYEIKDLGQQYTLGSLTFDKTLKVEQGDYLQTLIDTDFKYEIYAENIGLAYKYLRVLYHQPGDDTTGVLYTQKLIDYGIQ